MEKIRGFYDEGEIIKVITGVHRCGKSSLLEMMGKVLAVYTLRIARKMRCVYHNTIQ